MGIFEFLKKKSANNEQLDEAKVESQQEKKDEQATATIVPYPVVMGLKAQCMPSTLSMVDLEHLDWAKFGAQLKNEGVLPPSYDKKPSSVKISLGKNTNEPIVTLVFKSKTIGKDRTIVLSSSYAYDEFVHTESPVFVAENDPLGIEKSLVTRPFSPRTLELCVANLSKDAKLDEASDIKLFMKKCRAVQNNSIYETEDWDRVIKLLSDMLIERYNASALNVANEDKELVEE